MKPCAIWRASAELSWMGVVTVCHGPSALLLRFAASPRSVYVVSLQGRVMGGFSIKHKRQELFTAGSYIVISRLNNVGKLYIVQSPSRVCALCSIRVHSAELATFVASGANIWMCLYFSVQETVWNLQVHALDLVNGKDTMQVWWNNASFVVRGHNDQENTFYVYDIVKRVRVICEPEDSLTQVPAGVLMGTLEYLPGIGALCSHEHSNKIVLLPEGRIPHCKSLSRVAWLQACAV